MSSVEQKVFILAEQALLKTINQISDEQWTLIVPATMTSTDRPTTLREIVNHHVYDELWLPETLAGKTIDEVGQKFDGDLLGADPKASFAAAVDAAVVAVEALSEADMLRDTHLSYGDFPIREYLKHITAYRGFRAYTIAEFIGVDSTLDARLVQGLSDEVMPQIDQWRAWGVFGPPIETPDDADQQTKLLGLTGFLVQ